MAQLLAIDASARGEQSVSRLLAKRFIAHWQSVQHGGSVVRRDLAQAPPPFIDQAWIAGTRTPGIRHSPQMREAMRISDALIAEIAAADHILIATPMINFTIPAVLKAYVDQIVRIGATVTSQFEGMLRGKKATVIVASGMSYAPGDAWEPHDRAAPYLKQILNFLGIADVTLILAGGTLAVERGEMPLGDFIARFDGQLSAAAGQHT